jgi:hypothetical protein
MIFRRHSFWVISLVVISHVSSIVLRIIAHTTVSDGVDIENDMVENDKCVDATRLVVDDGVIHKGSTIDATIDSVSNTCGFTRFTVPGVWYALIGTGTEITVTLCSDDGDDDGDGDPSNGNRTITNYDSYISIFENSCDDLQCIGYNDDVCDLASAYSWNTTLNSTYYVYVHGFNVTGDFGITAGTHVNNNKFFLFPYSDQRFSSKPN